MSLIKYLVSYFYTSFLQGFANSFFSSTSFCSFHVFENFSSTSFLFFDLNWTNWRLPPSFLTKIIIIKLYEEYYMEKFS